jgi:steroid delta-isomerase-like uncharacterized protein
MSTEQHMAVIRRCFAELDRRNPDILDELCAPGYVAHFPGTPGPLAREAIKAVWQPFFAAFPDLRHTIEGIFAEGDRVVARLTIAGTHEGELMGIPPTGRAVTIGSINFFRFEGGAIAEQWVNYDALGMLQQLGAVPPAPQASA